MLLRTKLFHSSLRQISTIVSDDAMRVAKMKDHFFNKLNRRCRITLANRISLNPFSELVNSHQQVGLFILGSFERPNHIQPPDCKWPSNRNHPQLLSWHMSSSGKFLTTITFANEIFSIIVSRQPIKAMTKSLSHQGF